jgi:hypothetical protein
MTRRRQRSLLRFLYNLFGVSQPAYPTSIYPPATGGGTPPAPQIITRTAPATIGPYAAGQRPIDAYTPGTYASTAGTSIRTASWRVNGSLVAGTVTLIGAQTVDLTESVTDSVGTPARIWTYGPVAVPAIAPTVSVAINQGSIDVGDVLGTDITATPSITVAGSPALVIGDIAISWRVNNAPRAAGQLVTFGDIVRAVASWSHPAGAGSVQSATRTVPVAVAPTVTVALAEAAYTAGQTLDASDIEPTITSPGYPPLLLGDLVLSLRANGAPVSLPHAAIAGQSLVGRATWSHPAGAGTADSGGITVGAAAPAPQIIYSAGTGWVPHVVSDDAAGDLTFTLTVDGVTLGPFVRMMAQKTSGEAVNHVLPVIAVTTPAGTYAATTGIWTHGQSAATVASYQWRRDGVTISGATSATYATVGADAGTTLTCAVTVAGVSAVSNGIAIGGTGLTVTAATDGITVSGTTLAATGATDGITIAE